MVSWRQTTTTLVITLLDSILILSGATAIVMAFGARGDFSWGPLEVSAHNPVRPLLLAASVGVIRLVIGRRRPMLASLSGPGIQEHLEAERARFAAPDPAASHVKYYALVAAVGSLIWLTPQISNIRHVSDPFDPVFSAWRLARFTHQLLNEPARLFDGNIFHPAPDTLTYSDSTFLEGLVAFPFIAAGADPLVVSNALFLASFPLCALGFFYAGWRLTADPQAACIAGILGGVTTFKTEHYSHLELQFLCFAPLAVVTLLRMLAVPSWRTGACFGAMLTAQWLACMYLGVMLSVFLAPVACLAVVAWRVRPTRGLAAAIAASTAVIVIGGSLIAIPFIRSQKDRGDRPIDLVSYYSATPASYGAPNPRLVTYHNLISRADNLPERELFPGLMPFTLGAVGMVPPMSLGTIGLIAGAAVAFDSSLGTNGLVYGPLYRYVSPIRGMRVPARFAALVGMGLILLSAYGAKRVLRLGRNRGSRATIFAILVAAALIDVRIFQPLRPYPAGPPPIYAGVTRDMVLVEVPMRDANIYYMYFSTFHWARLINGYSGNTPASYGVLENDMDAFPTRELVQRLRRQGATHVTVNCRFLRPQRCGAMLEALDAMQEVELISRGLWQDAQVRLYAIAR